MVQEEVRNYEISVWTLQDDFITVLKAADIQRKGQTQEGELTLNVDGTQELSFSIPMYLYEGIKRIENPAWYDYKHGILIANMRKIKVILNKNTGYEDVFEFLIIKVTEKHDKGELYCEVECEGLAFHELGKTGYKISLSSDDFNTEYQEWFDNPDSTEEEEPQQNIQYWLNKFMEPYPEDGSFIDAATWYYSIEMDWSACTQFNGTEMIPRDINKIYEDEYVASWKLDETNNTLYPRQVEGYKEKWRPMDAEESNKYNLTQDLAEKFGVYCKYVYEHDKNYRITARRVIFYNNFIEEDKGPIDINYKYHTSSISREMDCTDLVTKMYIKAVDDDLSESGKITIMDVDANKSKEDYLLNFDYVHAVGAIDDEAYNYIETYEKEMYKLNNELIPLQDQLITLQTKLPEEEAKLTLYTNAIALDTENKNHTRDFINNLTNGTDIISVTSAKPIRGLIKTTNGVYYINFTEKGIIGSSVKIYNDSKLTSQIKIGKFEYDEFGSIIQATNLSNVTTSLPYLIFNYAPKTHYDIVLKTWESRLAADQQHEKEQQKILDNINFQIENCEDKIKNIQDEKDKLIKNFELLMGPALREGYWQPEDYTDYGDRYTDSFTINNTNEKIKGTTPLASFIWDTELFEDEQQIYYEVGAEQAKQYYPGFIITNLYNVDGVDWDKLAFLYYDSTYHSNDKVYKKSLVNGSRAKLVYLRDLRENSHGEIYPVLLLTGYQELSETEQKIIGNVDTRTDFSNMYDKKIGALQVNVDNDGVISTIEQEYFIPEHAYISPEYIEKGYFEIVVPRIKLSSLAVKNSKDQLSITYNGKVLENYEDYSVLTRTVDTEKNGAGYYITLNSDTMIREGALNNKKLNVLYTLSNANTSVYLDALEVMKDSSQPQVSYSVDVATVQKEYIQKVSRMLNRIVHINDSELKFENVQGYVSQVTLNLDKPWEDSIEVKNYKTKFEDLFTKIVASTEAMKKQSYVAGIVSNAFSADGSLQANALQTVLNNLSASYKNGDVIFNIDPSHGIMIQNNEGVLAFRDGGLFGATKKNTTYTTTASSSYLQLFSENDVQVSIEETTDWDWKTFITPAGINAKNMVIGQIDTNNVSIFAGDKKRFQLNSEGLFAYKETNSNNDSTDSPYVVLNSEGLFHREIHNEQEINKVEVSWDGFILRNNDGEEVFKANEDGNLNITGIINATGGSFTNGEIKILIDGQNNKYTQINTEGFILRDGSTEVQLRTQNANEFYNTNFLSGEIGYLSVYYHSNDAEEPTYQLNTLIAPGRFYSWWADKNIEGSDKTMASFSYQPLHGFSTSLRNGTEIRKLDVNLADNQMVWQGTLGTNSLIVNDGIKSKSVSTYDYSKRLLYCYETPTPTFGDIGEGIIGEDGYCYISLDPIFMQTIAINQYQIFLQKYGDGDCWILKRYGSYFIVQGTPNLKFGWEIKAKQRDYDQLRLEKYEEPFKLPKQSYGEEAEFYINSLKQGRILE